MHQDRIKELLQSSSGQDRFLAWIRDEITQLMLATARDMARARPPRSEAIEPSQSLFEYGASVRANEILDFLEDPTTLSRLVEGNVKKHPLPTYGAEDILKET